MHDRRDGGYDRRGSRHEHGCDERRHGRDEGRDREERRDFDGGSRGDCDDRRGGDRPSPRGGGPDTRFLQLEMSELLYAEAESVTKQAFRELLVEAAKARLRERFGDKIIGLAQLAVDEGMNDVLSSLDIEARIQEHNRERGRRKDRLRGIFADGGAGGERGSGHEGGDACEEEHPPGEGEGGGEGGHGPGPGRDENQ